MASVGIQHTDWDIWPGGPTDERLEDRGDGMPDLPGGQGAGRQGLHPEDDGRREDLQGAADGAGPMPVIREGSGKGVTSDALPEPERRG